MSDVPNLDDWIGRREERSDAITAFPAAALAATLDRTTFPAAGDPLPPAWHWLYFVEITPEADLAADGHAKRGGFLPPVPLPRRMWGGNRLVFHKSLPIGAEARRVSEIESIKQRAGRSGALAVVTVKHAYHGPDGLALEEWHDIVYREAARADAPAPPTDPPAREAEWRRRITPDPVFLFRYSALTFNGHRIHYDYPYVTDTEGYPGLIVHGPLTATLLAELLHREMPDARVGSITYRARRPLFADAPFDVAGTPTAEGCALWAVDPAGSVAMTADVVFA